MSDIEKSKPADAGDAATGSVGFPKSEKLTLFRAKRKAPYRKRKWLHINPDGSETWFRREPCDRRSLTVDFFVMDRQRWEVTYTWKTRNGDIVKPPGAGWEFCEANLCHATWLRSPNKGGVR